MVISNLSWSRSKFIHFVFLLQLLKKITEHFNAPCTRSTYVINVCYIQTTRVGNTPCQCFSNVDLSLLWFLEDISSNLADLHLHYLFCLSSFVYIEEKDEKSCILSFHLHHLRKIEIWVVAFEIEKLYFRNHLKGLGVTFCLLTVWSVFLHFH